MPCASNVIQRPEHGSGLRSNLSARATTTRSVATLAQLTTPLPRALWRMPAEGSTHIRTGEWSRPSEYSLCSRCKRSEFLLVTRVVRRHAGLRPGMVHSRRTGDRDAGRRMPQRPVRRCLGDIPAGDRGGYPTGSTAIPGEFSTTHNPNKRKRPPAGERLVRKTGDPAGPCAGPSALSWLSLATRLGEERA
jgi:hypothetical protein